MKLTQEICRQFYKKAGMSEESIKALGKESEGNAYVFAETAIRRGLADRDVAGMILGNSLGVTYLNLYKTPFQDDVLALLPLELAQKYQAIPIYQFGDTITIACTHPEDKKISGALSRILSKPVDLLFCLPDELNAAYTLRYQNDSKIGDIVFSFDFKQLVTMAPERLVELRPIIEIAESLLLLALKENASDIHIEPKEHDCVIRFRIDGVLGERLRLPIGLATPLTARYKIMAEMNISERRIPQDGRISFQTGVKAVDVRVSTLPILHGEKTVIRLMGSLTDSVPVNLDRLDILESNLRPFKETLSQPNGMIFVTGPTGSGKSTMLYAALNHINNPNINITTIEDPVEYEMATINQVQVNAKAGRDFGTVLRSILRQDPDVLLVGEIRDKETAQIACKAALTGHLVLSTLHTNNALQAITRLIDMGVEPYIVAPTIIGVLAQRLVRRLCKDCKIEHHDLDVAQLQRYFYWKNPELPIFYKPVGCKNCNGKGYKGRIGIHEFVKIDNTMRDYILQGRSYNDICNYAYSIGFKDLRFDGFIKALQGLTSLDEVIRVTADN
ncbi:MAG: GspE/PulE family protein [Methylococcales bacterium]|nr:GspE/PulE family protein [Methylococcales bacterium]MDD5753832.1 GspE/PulE family protein [Methylococcales bacterium]